MLKYSRFGWTGGIYIELNRTFIAKSTFIQKKWILLNAPFLGASNIIYLFVRACVYVCHYHIYIKIHLQSHNIECIYSNIITWTMGDGSFYIFMRYRSDLKSKRLRYTFTFIYRHRPRLTKYFMMEIVKLLRNSTTQTITYLREFFSPSSNLNLISLCIELQYPSLLNMTKRRLNIYRKTRNENMAIAINILNDNLQFRFVRPANTRNEDKKKIARSRYTNDICAKLFIEEIKYIVWCQTLIEYSVIRWHHLHQSGATTEKKPPQQQTDANWNAI